MRDVSDSVMEAIAQKRRDDDREAAKRVADDIETLTMHADAMERACARIASEVGCAWDADTVAENTKRVLDAIREKCR